MVESLAMSAAIGASSVIMAIVCGGVDAARAAATCEEAIAAATAAASVFVEVEAEAE
jgi:hypothetical protein